MSILKLPPRPPRIDELSVALLSSELTGAIDRLCDGKTTAIVLVELSDDGPTFSYAGLDNDPLRMVGLLSRVIRETLDMTEAEYE